MDPTLPQPIATEPVSTPEATAAPQPTQIPIATATGTPMPTGPQVHNITVYDDYFGPADVLVSEGDSVRWNWEANDPHDVNLASLPDEPVASYNGIFATPLRVNNYNAEFVFSREFLNAHPIDDSSYRYYCAPHWRMGMYGMVRVHRPTKPFKTEMHSWQVLPPSSSSATADCELMLNGREREVQVSCEHNVAGAVELHLRRGYLGEQGESACIIPGVADVISGACELDQSEADDLFFGGMYLELYSLGYPAGAVRGQIVHSHGKYTIGGKVTDNEGNGIAGIMVSDGVRSAVSDEQGYYIIREVPNGVYVLSAGSDRYIVTAKAGVNPVLVNRSNAFLRDFEAHILEP